MTVIMNWLDFELKGSASKASRQSPTVNGKGGSSSPVNSRPASGIQRSSPLPDGTKTRQSRPSSAQKESNGSTTSSRMASPKVIKQS